MTWGCARWLSVVRRSRLLGKPDITFVAPLCRGGRFQQPEQIFSEDQIIFDPHISHQL